MTKIFVTGATGYVGGDALTAIVAAHPDYEVAALARDEERAVTINQAFPNVSTVIGSLDNSDLLTREAAKVDVVCNWADCNHITSAESLLEGLSQRPSSSPGYLIQISATNIYTINQTLGSIPLGELTEKVYDDWDGLLEVINLPYSTAFRKLERSILEPKDVNVKTAIVCPSYVYGEGRGPGNKRSRSVTRLIWATFKKGHGVYIDQGLNHLGAVHVSDLSHLFLLLIEAASSGSTNATWNTSIQKKGYYFANSEDFEWKEISNSISQSAFAQGLVKDAISRKLTYDETEAMWPSGISLWGSNARIQAVRAKKLLDWQPKESSFKEDVLRTLNMEVKGTK